jgi:hypothetical protein
VFELPLAPQQTDQVAEREGEHETDSRISHENAT